MPNTIGVILAGGLARRMGGGDKGASRLGDQTILERLLDRLRPQCADVILNANGDPGRFAELGIPVVADEVPGFAGPLAGILAAADWASKRPRIAWIATVAGDTPFLPMDFVTRLHAERLAEGQPLACARSNGRTHPVNGLWSVSLREELRRALSEGERKVGRWAAQQGVAIADWSGSVDPFFNVNEPGDLAEARRLVGIVDQ